MHTMPLINTPRRDSDSILDPEVDYCCVGLFRDRDEVLAAYNEIDTYESFDRPEPHPVRTRNLR